MRTPIPNACAWTRKLTTAVAVGSMVSTVQAQNPMRRPITVDDAITMTRLADPLYFGGAPRGSYSVAQFSPDGTKFVVVLRTADVKSDSNVYKMYLFAVSDVFSNAQSTLICEMASSSNSAAISDVKWLSDNRHIAFLGAHGSQNSQVYMVDINTRELLQRTHHESTVDAFDISADGHTVAFLADPSPAGATARVEDGNEMVVNGHRLIDVLTGRWQSAEQGRDIFIETGDDEQRYQVPQGYLISKLHGTGIWISPSGEHVALTLTYRSASPLWARYDDKSLKLWASRATSQETSGVGESEIFTADVKQHKLKSAVNAPSPFAPRVSWSQDERSMYVKTFLPLSISQSLQSVSIDLQTGRLRQLTPDEWIKATPAPSEPDVSIGLEENVNCPPRLFARRRSDGRKALLIDLNPQFRDLEFGDVKPLTLSIRGVKVVMGIYLPPRYVPGRRYPLVIQTHGFDPDRFSMDGMDEWSTGFAARPLAAKGIVVLQTLNFATPDDAAKYQKEPSLGSTPAERARELEMEAYDAGIDALDAQGLIDPQRVGISGFSVTVMFSAFTLTHSSHHFAAAVLADGVDGGYFQYMAEQIHQFEEYTNGSPFTKVGLQHWLELSPSFSMGKVQTPIRVVALNRTASVLTMWEWYAALRMQNKPVEFISLRDAAHTMEKPSDRRIAMEGLADWFSFWLQGYEDRALRKSDQYTRWEELKRIADASTSVPAY